MSFFAYLRISHIRRHRFSRVPVRDESSVGFFPCLEYRYQGVTPFWKSANRISGYQVYQPEIRGIINGYQEKIDRISDDD